MATEKAPRRAAWPKIQVGIQFHASYLVAVYEKVQRSQKTCLAYTTQQVSVQQAFLVGEKMCNDAPLAAAHKTARPKNEVFGSIALSSL